MKRKASLILCALFAASAVSVGQAQERRPGLVSLENRWLRLTIAATNGHCEILDKGAGKLWGAALPQASFGAITVEQDGKTQRLDLGMCELASANHNTECLATFRPITDKPQASLRVTLKLAADAARLDLSVEPSAELGFANVTPLADTLDVRGPGAYAVVPCREGLLIPADSGLVFSHRFDSYAYEGCHMLMLGLVENGSTVLATWDDPYVAVEVKSGAAEPKDQSPSPSLASRIILSKSARSIQLRFPGRGDYVTIAKAYRQVAREKGYLVTWSQKLKSNPDRTKLFGAANIKLWSVLDRRMNEDSTKEEEVRVHWTFPEAAQVADHFKHDLKLDRVLFTIGGWIHRGYDNQHPDILPTAPECGGDEAFAACARRVMADGYLFCLHDNYQDIYRDSPSWEERFLMKTPDGKLARGGHWAGGTAFLTCSKMALELAKRPQNLPAVRALSHANAYFIDTTYAAGLQECYDPQHPLTRGDDLKWKQELSDYARSVFGVFGSECGREWAIAHSDFFEGLTGVSGHPYHDSKFQGQVGGSVVPLFELVYRDCIAMYGKYGYDPAQAAPYVLQHVIFGRPLNYHSIPAHLYWTQPPPRDPQPRSDGLDLFIRGDNGWSADQQPIDRFIKNTCEVLGPLNELTALMQMTSHEFLTPDRKVQRVIFGKGRESVTAIVNFGGSDFSCDSKLGGPVRLPALGFVVEGPTFIAFHSRNWNGVEYPTSPPLFTLRSLDDRPLARSRSIRVFHAFGENRLRLGKQVYSVRREAKLDPANARSTEP